MKAHHDPTTPAKEQLSSVRADVRGVCAAFVCLVGCVVACAGAASSTPAHDSSSAESGTEEDDAPYVSGEEAVGEPPDPCASGTCSSCGEGVCLVGFYCEESVSACGWLPQCADAMDCECVQSVLSDCSCEERGQGVYVDCD